MTICFLFFFIDQCMYYSKIYYRISLVNRNKLRFMSSKQQLDYSVVLLQC